MNNDWFESFLHKGLEQIQSICKENKIKPVIITVYAQQEGHKPLPTEHELKVFSTIYLAFINLSKIKQELEEKLKIVGKVPIVNFSEDFMVTLRIQCTCK